MKGKDLEAEATLAPPVFILGAQKKCKMEAKGIELQGPIFFLGVTQPHAHHIDNLSFDIF